MESAYRYGSSSGPIIGLSYILQSNAYGPNATANSMTAGWTLTTLDSVGRTIQVDHYSGTALPGVWATGSLPPATGTSKIVYDQSVSGCNGPVTQITDEAGNTRSNCSDGLNRLTSVTEPDPSSGAAGTVTTYGYDFLNNLQTVSVSGQANNYCTVGAASYSRCFSYSTLSRNGNLLTQTDANGTATTVAAGRHSGSLAISDDSRSG